MKNKIKYIGVALILVFALFIAIGPERIYAAAKSFTVQVAGAPTAYGGYLKFYDEDSMASDDADGLASQQSIKAYVDSSIGCSSGLAAGATNSIFADSSGYLNFEGATKDANETRIMAADPAADRIATLPYNTAAWAFAFSTLTTNAIDVANSVWLGTSQIIAEGSAADGSETTIAFTNPTADRTIYVPDASGTIPLVLRINGTQSGDTNTTWVGDSVTYVAGDTSNVAVRVRCGGTITGANAAKTVSVLVGSTTAILTMATPTSTIGDWSMTGTVMIVSGAVEKATGELHVRDGATYVDVADYGGATVDVTSGKSIKVKLTSAHGSDTVTKEMCTWELLP